MNVKPGAMAYGHDHGEAFMLMQYESRDGQHAETIWNSRDGVTPFVVSCAHGVEMTHVRWHEDTYAPDHQPLTGERIFVDLTPTVAGRHARENAERFWNDPGYPASQNGRWASVEELATELAAGYLEQQGSPTVVTVKIPRGHWCLVHSRQHPEGWEDECVSELDHAYAHPDLYPGWRPRPLKPVIVPRLTWREKIRAVRRCHRRGHHEWGFDSNGLTGIWIRCVDCRTLDEFIPGAHEPKGARALHDRYVAGLRAGL